MFTLLLNRKSGSVAQAVIGMKISNKLMTEIGKMGEVYLSGRERARAKRAMPWFPRVLTDVLARSLASWFIRKMTKALTCQVPYSS